MMCYLDKTWCASEIETHTCGREISEEHKKRADELNLPIAWGLFCKEAQKLDEKRNKKSDELMKSILNTPPE